MTVAALFPSPAEVEANTPVDAGPRHRRHPDRVAGRRGRRTHDHGDEHHPRRRVHLEQPAHRIRRLPGADLGVPDHAAVLLCRRRGLRRLLASRRQLGQLADAPLHPAVPAGVLLPGVLGVRAGDSALLPARARLRTRRRDLDSAAVVPRRLRACAGRRSAAGAHHHHRPPARRGRGDVCVHRGDRRRSGSTSTRRRPGLPQPGRLVDPRHARRRLPSTPSRRPRAHCCSAR